MNFDLTSDQSTFREALGQFLSVEVPIERQQIFGGRSEVQYQFSREINRKLAARNWLAVGLPEEYGGGGKGPIEQGILDQELGYHLILESGACGLTMVAPAIMAFGNKVQKDLYLELIAKGEIEFCHGLDTVEESNGLPFAERDGAGYILNGCSISNSYTEHADYMYLLVRTGDGSQDVSHVIVDMKTSGIRLEIFPSINGQTAAKIHFENVSVSDSCLIGEEHQGLHQTIYSPNYERTGLRRYGSIQRVFDDFTDFCYGSAPDGGQPLAEHPLVRHQLAQRRLGMMTMKLLCWNVAWLQSVGAVAIAESSAALLFASEERLRFAEMAMEVLGPYATLRNGSPMVPLLGNIEGIYRESLNLSESGTSDMHRNIIAQQALGMPLNDM